MNGQDKLTFGDLKVGDKFIVFPQPGDDAGHGGYRAAHFIFVKTKKVQQPARMFR
ncbi:MAG: hypothetical protein Q8O87_02515 [bacterium]|nr:hypothetical protein [bacterium]